MAERSHSYCSLDRATLTVLPLSTEPLILLFRQSYADGFTFDFARPLIAGAAGPRSAVLHVTFADPAGLRQAAAELGVLGFPAGQVRLWLRLHERKSSSLVNKAVYIPL